jgi:hypothetical protein
LIRLARTPLIGEGSRKQQFQVITLTVQKLSSPLHSIDLIANLAFAAFGMASKQQSKKVYIHYEDEAAFNRGTLAHTSTGFTII